jgi:ABC-type multidrug transport system ATPase subunit
MAPRASCLDCGADPPAGARFCDRCGAALPGGDGSNGRRSWMVGSAAGCDLVVDRPAVSARHCRLTELDDGFWLEDLQSTNGTFVDGQPIAARRVTDENRITLGREVPLALPVSGPARVITIGSASDNDVVLDYPMISAHHARLVTTGSRTEILDLGSTNGTAVGDPDRKISRSPLSSAQTVYFGSLPLAASRLLAGNLALGERPHHTLAFEGEFLVLGRDPDCDVVLDYPMVSWRHARLRRSGDRITIEDLGSTNGTYVNGGRISGTVPIAIEDLIGLGSYTLRLTGLGTLEQRDYRGNVTIEARNVSIELPGRRLRIIDDVSMTVLPGELVGVMGSSGAGKTTLLSALNGYLWPSSGAVLFNDQVLHANYGRFRMHIGYVPQDDIMHRDLTVREALYYSARLRLPGDMSDREIHQRIGEVLEQLEIPDVRDKVIGSPERKTLSGGQRKRVNLAMELLTDPIVLFLDEPTSGLSSTDALVVMDRLRKLADQGKTILVTIHQPSTRVFDLMDDLVVLSKEPRSPDPARLVYFGPARESARFFDCDAEASSEPVPDRVLSALEPGTTASWVARFAASRYHRIYVEERRVPGPASPQAAQRAEPSGGAAFAQWWTLLRRGFTIKRRDTWNVGILLAQAPIVAVLLALVFGGQMGGSEPDASTAVAVVLFLMAVAAIWFGCSNSAREIVAEWAIYHRERMVNLRLLPYIGSKLALLSGLCLVQCSLLLLIVEVGCGRRSSPPSLLQQLLLLLLAAVIGVAVGLLVSAASRTSEVAISLVPLIVLPMVILGGSMQPLHKMPGYMQTVASAMPSRWEFEGLLRVEDARRRASPAIAATPAAAASAAGALPVGNGAAAVDPRPPGGGATALHDGFFRDSHWTLAEIVGVSAVFLFGLMGATVARLRSRDVH